MEIEDMYMGNICYDEDASRRKDITMYLSENYC